MLSRIWEKLEYFTKTPARIVNTVQPLWKTLWQFLKMLNTVMVGSGSSNPRYIPNRKKKCGHTETSTHTLIVASLITDKK